MGKVKMVELALQGGGSHGAFTWGVLDRLLEDERIVIEGVCGTSAGAMNAVVVADGLDRQGKEGAREALYNFWHKVSKAGALSPIQRSPLDRMLGRWSLDHSPGYIFFDLLTRLLSPYKLNPLNINPLKTMLEKLIDFDHVRKATGIKLFVAATNVRTGKLKIFRREEMTAEMVLASTCLPFAYQAVEIEGEAYWDGGYMGNPSLYPLVESCNSNDLIIVQINPVRREEIPLSAAEISNRINEITFNSSLIKEIRTIALLKKLIEELSIEGEDFKNALSRCMSANDDIKILSQVLFHRISSDAELNVLSASSKLNTEWSFLKHLHDIGYRTADQWLKANFDALGNYSTLDIESVYLHE